MKILISNDNKTYHLLLKSEIGPQVWDHLKKVVLRKEKERGSPLKNPSPERKSKEGEPPLPPFNDDHLNLNTRESQDKNTKAKKSPPYAEIYNLAKEHFPDLNFRTTTQKRNRKIRQIWNANNKSSFVFEELFKMASASDFLNSRNGHTFRGNLSLSWIIERAEDILDGKYTNDRMSWALDKKENLVDGIVVGVGKTKVDPTKAKFIGDCEVTGLPKFIIKQDETKK